MRVRASRWHPDRVSPYLPGHPPKPPTSLVPPALQIVLGGGLLWLAIAHPLAAASVLALLILLMLWLLPRMWRTGRRVARRLSGFLRYEPAKSKDAPGR